MVPFPWRITAPSIPFSPNRPKMLRTHREFGMDRAHRGCKGRWNKGTVYRRQGGHKWHRRVFREQERPPELQVHSRCSKGHMFVFSRDHSASSLQLSHLWPGLERALLPVGMQAGVTTSAHQSSSSCKTSSWCPLPLWGPCFLLR